LEVTLSARHMQVPDGLKEFAAAKVEHLDRLFRDITKIEIKLDAADGGHRAQLIAHQRRGGAIIALSTAPDTRAAIDAVIEKMDHQLRKRKEILRERKKKGVKSPGEIIPEEMMGSGEIEEGEEEQA